MALFGARLRAMLVGLGCVIPLVALGTQGDAGAASPAASAPGVTAKAISVGLVESQTGPASSTFGDSARGAQARIDLQNAQGGVDGRKLKLVVADDTSTPSGNQLAVEDLVSTKGVFGVMSSNAVLVGGANFLQQQGVPVTATASTITTDEPQYTDEFSYTQGQLPSPPTTQLAQVFKDIGVKNVGLLDYSDPQDSTLFPVEEKGIQGVDGLNICFGSDSIPIGSVNFTTIALQLKNANCQAVDFPAVESSDIALATALQQAGLHIKQIYATGYDQTLLDDAAARTAAQGQYFDAEPLPLDLNTPAVKGFYAALRKYDPSYHGGIASFGEGSGWMIADEMIEGLKLAGPNPTRAGVIKDLARVTSYSGGGLVPPVNLSARWKLIGPQCAYYVQLEGSKFLPFPRSGKPICGKVLSGS
ncbi:MAG TPA: ABC transporter substrate-binding protein [Acidimicrobiales bacterium]|jgi:branched-chain amino acid transport system substrate-binding protein